MWNSLCHITPPGVPAGTPGGALWENFLFLGYCDAYNVAGLFYYLLGFFAYLLFHAASTLKMYQLQLIRGTRMADEYVQCPTDFHLFGLNDYIDTVVDYIERLRPTLVLERFASQSPKELLVAPDWGIKNYELVDKVKKRMRERNTWQGRLY